MLRFSTCSLLYFKMKVDRTVSLRLYIHYSYSIFHCLQSSDSISGLVFLFPSFSFLVHLLGFLIVSVKHPPPSPSCGKHYGVVKKQSSLYTYHYEQQQQQQCLRSQPLLARTHTPSKLHTRVLPCIPLTGHFSGGSHTTPSSRPS